MEIQAQPACAAYADGDIVQRIVENLLDNAIRFSPTGEPVTVPLGPEGGGVVVCVLDRQPIPPLCKSPAADTRAHFAELAAHNSLCVCSRRLVGSLTSRRGLTPRGGAIARAGVSGP